VYFLVTKKIYKKKNALITRVCVAASPRPLARALSQSFPAVMAAPVAPLDEDWEDFNEFKAADSTTSWTAEPENSPQIQSFASFDETLSASFPDSSSAFTSVSVRAVSEHELLRDDE